MNGESLSSRSKSWIVKAVPAVEGSLDEREAAKSAGTENDRTEPICEFMSPLEKESVSGSEWTKGSAARTSKEPVSELVSVLVSQK